MPIRGGGVTQVLRILKKPVSVGYLDVPDLVDGDPGMTILAAIMRVFVDSKMIKAFEGDYGELLTHLRSLYLEGVVVQGLARLEELGYLELPPGRFVPTDKFLAQLFWKPQV